VALLGALGVLAAAQTPSGAQGPSVFEGPVGRADCGPGSRPEVGVQGEVPLAERQSGRSTEGYRCNLEAVGVFAGEGAQWQHAWHGDCAYYDTKLNGGQRHPGTIVVDATDRARPRMSTSLTTAAMLDPWESLKVNQRRGLLAGVLTAGFQGAGYFDVYDVSRDCRAPDLKASITVNGLGHEGEWAPDGRTYYATGIDPGVITAIDVSNPMAPRPLLVTRPAETIHGLGVSADGNRLYLAHLNGPRGGNGLGIYDISSVNRREALPRIEYLGEVDWTDGETGQHAIPLTIGGRPHVLFVDEGKLGGARIIDAGDERNPRVISKLKLEIQMPQNAMRAYESGGWGKADGTAGGFGYNAHYCNVDRLVEPTIAACSEFEAGLRVFDIRDPARPREIAYFNPGGNNAQQVPGSIRGGGTSGYTTAQPRIDADRGEIWFTDQDKGFHVVRFTNGVWPFGQAQALGLPPARACTRTRRLAIRVRAPRGQRMRYARIYVNGRRVRTVRGRRARTVRVRIRDNARVRVVLRARSGRTFIRERRYRACT
jgi:hypothetical protein